MSFFQKPHKRYNPLTGEWILVSPHRISRPWQGKVEELPPDTRPEHDPKCYLCPGNTRAGGHQNPEYTESFVFVNDFSALLPEVAPETYNIENLLMAHSESGECRVICYSPKHNLTLAEMTQAEVRKVVTLWIDQFKELSARPDINYVQIFENKGAIMGCSNPHPHGQIWSTQTIPLEPEKEELHQSIYAEQNPGKCLLCSVLETELKQKERIVVENDTWVALVPFWAKWPFETLVLPKQHHRQLPELSENEQHGLADILSRMTIKYDNLFKVSFPYTMGFHNAPCDGKDYPAWHLHLHFYPPLLRSATVQKFMVGFEMLANPQRDITPESAAQQLRELPEIHYRLK